MIEHCGGDCEETGKPKRPELSDFLVTSTHTWQCLMANVVFLWHMTWCHPVILLWRRGLHVCMNKIHL